MSTEMPYSIQNFMDTRYVPLYQGNWINPSHELNNKAFVQRLARIESDKKNVTDFCNKTIGPTHSKDLAIKTTDGLLLESIMLTLELKFDQSLKVLLEIHDQSSHLPLFCVKYFAFLLFEVGKYQPNSYETFAQKIIQADRSAKCCVDIIRSIDYKTIL